MKNLILILACALLSFTAIAQDKIYLSDNSVIAGKVIEINTTDVKYKKWENLTGPDYVLPKSQIAMIIYENGTHEVLNGSGADKPGEVAMIDILPSWKVGKNLAGVNYFDLVYKNITLNYTRFFCNYRFSAGISASAGFTYRNNTYDFGTSFLNFDRDYFHSVFSFNYFPTGMNKVSYYTGLSFMAGSGGEFQYDYYGPYTIVNKSYYGFYVNNGVQFNFTRYFNMRSSLALGLVDRDMNGDFQTHALFELAAGIRF